MNRVVLLALALASTSAFARDTRLLLPIADVFAMPEAAGRLDPNFRFFFGKQPAPEGEARGQVVANAKTNASNKGDVEACKWVMLSALVELQEKARRVGATSVVAIDSWYKKIIFTSETEYECHAGNVVAGVTLRGQAIR
jgi:hypothetical protein